MKHNIEHVIVINVDTIRRDFIGSYGNDWIKTPHIDEFRKRAIRFDQCFLGSYPCLPNRRDIWTGLFEFPFRGWGPIEEGDYTLSAQLGDHGVQSMFITDNYFLLADEIGATNYQTGFTGWHLIRGNHTDRWKTDSTVSLNYPCSPDKLKNQGKETGWFDRYIRNTAEFRDENGLFYPDKTYAAQVLSHAAQWLQSNHTLDKFFLWIDCFDPHEPWDPPAPYHRMYNPSYSGEEVVSPPYTMREKVSITTDELRHMRALYAGKITMTDHWLGKLFETIDKLGLFKNSLVIVSTDHGILFGEHNIIGKPHMMEGPNTDCNLYDELVHIPLFISYPDCAPGICDAIIQPVDLFATIMEALGVKPRTPMHSKSLWPLLEGTTQHHRDYAIMGTAGECINIADKTWRLFAWPQYHDSHLWKPLRHDYNQQLSKIYPRRRWFEPYGDTFPRERELFNIIADPQQNHNRYSDSSKVAASLLEAARDALKQINAPGFHQATLSF